MFHAIRATSTPEVNILWVLSCFLFLSFGKNEAVGKPEGPGTQQRIFLAAV